MGNTHIQWFGNYGKGWYHLERGEKERGARSELWGPPVLRGHYWNWREQRKLTQDRKKRRI